MKNEEMLKELDDIDGYMLQNVNQENKISNSQEILARMHLAKIQQIKEELENKNVEGFIKNRVDQTENALLFAMSKMELLRNNQYFLWLNSVKQNTNMAEPNYSQLCYEISTGHMPAFQPSYIEEYFQNGAIDITELLLDIKNVQQEYDTFTKQDKEEKSMLPIKRRNSIQGFFDKLLKIFQRKEETKPITPEIKAMNSDISKSSGHRNFCDGLSNIVEPIQNYKQDLDSLQQQPEETIVISDLHGKMDRWEQVKKSIKQNPNMKVIILGDAMDRGNSGLEILLQIKELSDEGKVEYLPGNHDVFAYNYVKTQELLQSSKKNQSAIRYIFKRNTAFRT